MTAFTRGIKLYLVVLAFLGTLTIVWGANGLLLDNTSTGTGWPVLIAVSVAGVGLGVLVHAYRTTDEGGPTLSPYPWSSIDRK